MLNAHIISFEPKTGIQISCSKWKNCFAVILLVKTRLISFQNKKTFLIPAINLSHSWCGPHIRIGGTRLWNYMMMKFHYACDKCTFFGSGIGLINYSTFSIEYFVLSMTDVQRCTLILFYRYFILSVNFFAYFLA